MTSVSRILKPGARRTNQDTKEKETSIYTTQQAINRMRDYLDKNLPRQHLENNMEYTLEKFLHQGNPDSLWGWFNLTVRYNVSFSVGCDIYLTFREEPEISWSSTHRSIINAAACVALYGRAVEFAAGWELVRLEEVYRLERAKKESK